MGIRDDIVDRARAYLGAPFVHKGRSADGIDCVGLIYVAACPFVPIEDPRDYPRQVTSMSSFMRIREYADRIGADEAGPGDIVLMNSGGRSTHYGLIAGETVIHADQLIGRVVEHSACGLNNDDTERRAVAYFRLKGVPAWGKPDA